MPDAFGEPLLYSTIAKVEKRCKMLCPNDLLLHAIQREKSQQYHREAEIDHWLDEINPRRPSWLACQARKAVRNLGHLFVALGRRLDRIESRST